jgi:hypothetical protein
MKVKDNYQEIICSKAHTNFPYLIQIIYIKIQYIGKLRYLHLSYLSFKKEWWNIDKKKSIKSGGEMM